MDDQELGIFVLLATNECIDLHGVFYYLTIRDVQEIQGQFVWVGEKLCGRTTIMGETN